MHTLLLRLTGPMQAWGTQSRFSMRDTGRVPTKSGVLGLVCAALGKPRDERPADGLPTLATLAALQMGVRVERPGQLRRDYQTASDVLKAGATRSRIERGNPELKATEPSERFYLADAWFTVGLAGDDRALLASIDQALGAPRWPLALGRKACPPGFPVRVCDNGRAVGVVDAPLVDALTSFRDPAAAWLSSQRQRNGTPHLVIDRAALPAGREPGALQVTPDTPVSFAPRRFVPRETATLDLS